MSKIYVYSTLTGGQKYTGWAKGGNDIPRVAKTVAVNGGANLPSRHLSSTLLSSAGAVTEISAEDEAFLREHPIFKLHMAHGYVRIDKKDMPVSKGVEGLEKRDVSAPDTPADIQTVAPELTGGVEGVKENVRAKRQRG
jgi:hypothetical protein